MPEMWLCCDIDNISVTGNAYVTIFLELCFDKKSRYFIYTCMCASYSILYNDHLY